MAPRRCNFRHPRFEDGQCPRPAKRAWTMCPSHYSAGRAYAKPKIKTYWSENLQARVTVPD